MPGLGLDMEKETHSGPRQTTISGHGIHGTLERASRAAVRSAVQCRARVRLVLNGLGLPS